MTFRIYYPDKVVEGETREDWVRAPTHGVQVVVRFPRQDLVRWSFSKGTVTDRDLWTGTDEYDPFGWGVKYGQLMTDRKYLRIWENACGDSNPNSK